jgi:RNA polymerase sigma factor (sigma-70 family)
MVPKMFHEKFAKTAGADVCQLDSIELFQICADDCENSDAWMEFLRRFTTKMKYFLQGTLRQNCCFATGGMQEGDLFQNAIVRLVENDCVAMKRFSGSSENDLLGYLAVICRSSVLDTLRRTNALKRRPKLTEQSEAVSTSASPLRLMNHPELERDLLLREIVFIARQTIHSQSSDVSARDQLIFKLHFEDGLSYSQIAQCEGINLSKAGVEKVLQKLVGRLQTLASAGKIEDM